MTATTMRRRGDAGGGGGAARPRPGSARKGAERNARAAERTGPGAIDRVFAWLPLTELQLQCVFLAFILALAAALAIIVAVAAGVPGLIGEHVVRLSSDAGFEVRRVDVRGVRNMNALRVYEHVLSERHRAMAEVDLAAIRRDLLALSWVKDARVSRQLPDALVIDIVERAPHAVLRRPGGRLMLIDDEGRELDQVAADKVGRMLIVSGPGAGQRTVELDRTLDAAPALRPQVREAEWIGNRRWNLTFRTGQVLALPEGQKPAMDALITFARIDGTSRLIGGRFTAFDMRSADRIYLRLPGLAAEDAAAEAQRRKENP